MHHVALISPFDPRPSMAFANRGHYGGVERYVWALAERLVRSAWTVTIHTSSPESYRGLHGGVRVIANRRWATPAGAALAPWPAPLLRDSVDLLHVQATYPFCTEWTPVLAAVLDVPAIATCHFDVVGPTPRAAGMARAYYGVLGAFASSFDRVIFSTVGYSRSSILARFLKSDRVRVIPMGLDPGVFRLLPEVPKRSQILFVGRLAWFKGLHVLLKAFARFSQEHPGWRLLIVGDGPMRGLVEEQVRRERLDVELRPWVDDDELVRLYNQSAVTVLPSIASPESFGMTLIESLACGTPVVASDWPGVREVAGLGGLTAVPGDANSLANALYEIVSAPGDESRRAEVAGQIVARFSWDRIASDTAAVYEELL